MTKTEHASFTIDRVLAAPRALVWSAWATREGKDRWFATSDGLTLEKRAFDFRVGGTEIATGRWTNGTVSEFEATYADIVPEKRIVYSYVMHINGTKISVSLATVEFIPEGAGTRLRITEQGAFLDGYDDNGSREAGTRELVETLARSLA
ncbi:MAG: SRPBCC family protein [Sphingosinicella sp.]|nr:SRPBCC family protein [Sphingosinicella sp.]